MYQILIVEDDQAIHQLIEEILKKTNLYEVASAYSGTEAVLQLQHRSFDLILLDLMLPGLSGHQVLQTIQDKYHGGVIVVSAVGELDDKVQLLRLGADDYLTKPFHQEELLARIESVLRRYGHQPQEQADSSVELSFKDLILNHKKHRAFLRGSELHLTATEFDILKILLSDPQEVFTRERIYQKIWADEMTVEDNAINVHVSNLRKKIAALAGDEPYIQTVWGIGFKMDESYL
ncbi:response regulator transcription factor [Hutsoniella sourekii]